MATTMLSPTLEPNTARLASHEMFSPSVYLLPPTERALLSLKKAKAIAAEYSLSLDDIRHLSPKFWKTHTNLILAFDGAATTHLTIQYNLALGTLLDTTLGREDLNSIKLDILNFRVAAQFCLTEIDHGLDAWNIETTATQSDGAKGYILHTPHPGAAKYMPPTIPCGMPCVAVVFARLVVDGIEQGIRPFLVSINDGHRMCSGVSARALPHRGGAHPVNHALTSFDHVQLPPGALLQQDSSPTAHIDERRRFQTSLRRVAIGALALAGTAIPAMATSAYTAARYSQRRLVAANHSSTAGTRVPIFSFKTQQSPIFVALAQSIVLEKCYDVTTALFRDSSMDSRVLHGLAAAFKVAAITQAQEANISLSERCGAQGLFNYNGISGTHSDMRGIAIAEGDLLGLSIRLVSELMIGRYQLPPSSNPSSPLAAHEEGLLFECQKIMMAASSHRGEKFDRYILPRCQMIVESIGHRMIYDAGVDCGADPVAVELYLVSAMKRDPCWYSENLGITSSVLWDKEEAALQAAIPRLETWLSNSGAAAYSNAPIVSAQNWAKFTSSLDHFTPQSRL